MVSEKVIDLSEFEATRLPPGGCWFTKLTDEQREKVMAARAAGYSYVQITSVVRSWGITGIRGGPIGDNGVRNHIGRRCSCG